MNISFKPLMLPTLLFLLFTFSVKAEVDPETCDFVVAADGSGDFTKVQEAIDAVPHLRKNTTSIFIKNGVYKEKLLLPSTKTNVHFIGESVDGTVITYDHHAKSKNSFGEEVGTSGSSGFYVYGHNFTAENITFSNTAGPVGQAVAVRVDGDKVIFKNCKFLGFQDTLYPHGKNSRQYYKNCYIEGTVDFIFGWSTALFDSCEIYCKNHGYITAASTEEGQEFGFVFLNCNIKGDGGEETFFLGRPWRPYSNVVFIHCNLDKNIRPEGWNNWGSEEKEKTAFYAEYKCSGKGYKPEERVKWSHQLSDKQAEKYTIENIFGDWNPNE